MDPNPNRRAGLNLPRRPGGGAGGSNPTGDPTRRSTTAPPDDNAGPGVIRPPSPSRRSVPVSSLQPPSVLRAQRLAQLAADARLREEEVEASTWQQQAGQQTQAGGQQPATYQQPLVGMHQQQQAAYQQQTQQATYQQQTQQATYQQPQLGLHQLQLPGGPQQAQPGTYQQASHPQVQPDPYHQPKPGVHQQAQPGMYQQNQQATHHQASQQATHHQPQPVGPQQPQPATYEQPGGYQQQHQKTTHQQASYQQPNPQPANFQQHQSGMHQAQPSGYQKKEPVTHQQQYGGPQQPQQQPATYQQASHQQPKQEAKQQPVPEVKPSPDVPPSEPGKEENASKPSEAPKPEPKTSPPGETPSSGRAIPMPYIPMPSSWRLIFLTPYYFVLALLIFALVALLSQIRGTASDVASVLSPIATFIGSWFSPTSQTKPSQYYDLERTPLKFITRIDDWAPNMHVADDTLSEWYAIVSSPEKNQLPLSSLDTIQKLNEADSEKLTDTVSKTRMKLRNFKRDLTTRPTSALVQLETHRRWYNFFTPKEPVREQLLSRAAMLQDILRSAKKAAENRAAKAKVLHEKLTDTLQTPTCSLANVLKGHHSAMLTKSDRDFAKKAPPVSSETNVEDTHPITLLAKAMDHVSCVCEVIRLENVIVTGKRALVQGEVVLVTQILTALGLEISALEVEGWKMGEEEVKQREGQLGAWAEAWLDKAKGYSSNGA